MTRFNRLRTLLMTATLAGLVGPALAPAATAAWDCEVPLGDVQIAIDEGVRKCIEDLQEQLDPDELPGDDLPTDEVMEILEEFLVWNDCRGEGTTLDPYGMGSADPECVAEAIGDLVGGDDIMEEIGNLLDCGTESDPSDDTTPGWQNGIVDWAIGGLTECPAVATPWIPAYLDLGSITEPFNITFEGAWEQCVEDTKGLDSYYYDFHVTVTLQRVTYNGGQLFQLGKSKISFPLIGSWTSDQYRFESEAKPESARKAACEAARLSAYSAAMTEAITQANTMMEGKIVSGTGQIWLVGKADGSYTATTGPMDGTCSLTASIITRDWTFSCDFVLQQIEGVVVAVHANGRSLATAPGNG